MRIATWNLWWRFGPWEARQPAIRAELERVRPDVCGLQEVWAEIDDDGLIGRDQASELAAASEMHFARSRRASGVPHRFGNAVLSRFPILDSFTIDLPDEDSEQGRRSAVFARIDVPDADQPWWVISTHLDWRYGSSDLRQRQLARIVATIAELRADAAVDSDADPVPVVLTGDLNATAETDEVRRLVGASTPYVPGLVFTDAWSAVGDGPGHTWTRENPHAKDAQWPRRRLDMVMVAWPRAKPTANPLRAELFGTKPHPTETGIDLVPSDHYGVVVDLDRRHPRDLL